MQKRKHSHALKSVMKSKIRKALQDKYGFKNEMQIPKLDKIVISMSPGRDAVLDRKVIESTANDLSLICRSKAGCNKSQKIQRIFQGS